MAIVVAIPMTTIVSWISLVFVLGFLFSAVLIIPNIQLQPQTNNVQGSSYRGDINGTPPSLTVSNIGVTSVSVTPGESYIGHFTIKSLESVNQTLPIRFYLSSGSATSNSTEILPTGIIISISGLGEAFQIHPSAIANVSSNPLNVGLFTKNAPLLFLNGTATFAYSISVSSSTPQGIYDLQVVVVNYFNSNQQFISYMTTLPIEVAVE